MIEFTNYDDWHAHCVARSWSGPYRIMGRLQTQFTGPNGTEALWNYHSGRGVVLRDDGTRAEGREENPQ